jgi:hypothetical protein
MRYEGIYKSAYCYEVWDRFAGAVIAVCFYSADAEKIATALNNEVTN